MTKGSEIKCLFLDIGGVLLTNGWDTRARKQVANHFLLKKAEREEIEERHHMVFEIYEEGKLTLAEYLRRAVFFRKRPFTQARYRAAMFAQSKPYRPMLELFRNIKAKYQLPIVVVSNEGRELNDHRIQKFALDGLIDFFVSSCFVGIRKPDGEIFRLAMELSQFLPENILYVENTPMFVEIAERMKIRSILHTNFKSTCSKLASFGLLSGREGRS